jgi:hypothetical protein
VQIRFSSVLQVSHSLKQTEESGYVEHTLLMLQVRNARGIHTEKPSLNMNPHIGDTHYIHSHSSDQSKPIQGDCKTWVMKLLGDNIGEYLYVLRVRKRFPVMMCKKKQKRKDWLSQRSSEVQSEARPLATYINSKGFIFRIYVCTLGTWYLTDGITN